MRLQLIYYIINAKEIFKPNSNLIENKYIILFKNDIKYRIVDTHLDKLKARLTEDENIENIYFNEGFKGYSGKFNIETINGLKDNPYIDIIEQDSILHSFDMTYQKDVSWGLARISHREKLTLDTYNYYDYDDNAGEGVTAYVLDTGIYTEHTEFEGRAKWGTTTPKNDKDIDANGHGTHCAGTIAGKTYGIAKKAKLVAVKVLNSEGYGSDSEVIKGIDWTIKHNKKMKVESLKNKDKKYNGSVANMSLGGSNSKALDKAVNIAVEKGIHFGVAAGNENGNACLSSPAAADKAITVAASTINDERAFFSNYGECVDIFAPGLYILSSWIGNKNNTNVISGTSMATPHVVGLMAYYLSLHGQMSHDEMRNLLFKNGGKDYIKDIKKHTPNIIIYNDSGK